MSGFIVVFDDEMGYCAPLGWDADCNGAIEACGVNVALFATQKRSSGD